MKLTINQLKQIINEELTKVLKEGASEKEIQHQIVKYKYDQYLWTRNGNDFHAMRKGLIPPVHPMFRHWSPEDFQQVIDAIEGGGEDEEAKTSLEELDFWWNIDADWIISKASENIDMNPKESILAQIADDLRYVLEEEEINLEDENVSFEQVVNMIYNEAKELYE